MAVDPDFSSASIKFCTQTTQLLAQTNKAKKWRHYVKKHSRHVNTADSGMSRMYARHRSSESISVCAANAWHNSRHKLKQHTSNLSIDTATTKQSRN